MYVYLRYRLVLCWYGIQAMDGNGQQKQQAGRAHLESAKKRNGGYRAGLLSALELLTPGQGLLSRRQLFDSWNRTRFKLAL